VSARRRIALIAVSAFSSGSAVPLVASSAHADTTATTVFVGATGGAVCSDTAAGAGTAATPFCGLQAAVDSPLTGPGTTVLVAAGTYTGQVNLTKSGTAGAPITLRSASLADGGRAEIDGMVSVNGAHDITVDGFDIYSESYGVNIEGSSDVLITRDRLTNWADQTVADSGIVVAMASSAVTISDDVILNFGGGGVSADSVAGLNIVADTLNGNTRPSAGAYTIDIGGTSSAVTVENDILDAPPSVPAGSAVDYNVIPFGVVGPHDIKGSGLAGSLDDVTPGDASPAIDAADETAAAEPATDLFGDTAVNDPLVPNTGTGSGFRDRGAAERTHGETHHTLTLTPASGDAPLTVTATVTEQLGWGLTSRAASYSFNFEGTELPATTSPTAQYTYTNPAYFRTVGVTVYDSAHNAIDYTTANVSIGQPVHGTLAVTTSGLTVVATGTVSGPVIGDWTIAYGDGASSTFSRMTPQNSASHTYAKAGTYPVTLTANGIVPDDTTKITQTVTVTAPPPPPPAVGTTPVVHRIAGADRYATSIAASQARWSTASSIDGAPADDQAQAVVLARGDAFPDALAGVPLAAYKHGPLLLTDPAALGRPTLDEIRRVLPADGRHTVYILGGNSAVSPAIASQLHALGYNVVRYGGADRYGTALQIAQFGLGSPEHVIVATGDTFADALAAGPFAANSAEVVDGKPAAILLSGMSNGNEAITDPGTAAYLNAKVGANGGVNHCVNPNLITAVGGPALSAFLALEHTGSKYACVDGIVGADRYATSSQLAEEWGPSMEHPGVAVGTAFPDALSGGAYEAGLGQPLLLTDPASLPGPTAGALGSMNPVYETTRTRSVVIFGGPSAVSGGVENAIVSDVHGRAQF
jgi:PKD repeat protein